MIATAGQTLEAQNAAVSKVRSVRPVGTRAVLAELSGTQDVLALQTLLLEHPLPGQLDVLAAAQTVLVTAHSPVAARRIAAPVAPVDPTAPVQRDGELVVIDTVYDGEDLAEVGQLTGLGTDGVIAAHTGQVWTVAFAGFAPGFSVTRRGRIRCLRCRGAAPRAPRSPPVRWRWPVTIRPCTRAGPREAGS